MQPRQKELVGKTFFDKEGNKYEGWRYILEKNEKMDTGYDETQVRYKNGKLHGEPAIVYQDGREEDWQDGFFVKVAELPFSQR